MFPEGRALEFLIAGVVALIVVGPKDLPLLMRKLGQFLGKLRAMAAEFRSAFDEMARQSELDELRKEVEAMRSAQAADTAVQADLQDSVADIRASLTDIGADLSAPSEPPPQAETLAGPAPDGMPEPAAARPARPRRRKRAEPEA
jgi:sec-independent protein translocase protein TatB